MVRRRFALLLPLALLAFGSAGAEGPARAPGAAATAWAIKISPSGGAAVTTAVAASPPNAAAAAGGSFSYPSDGSIVSAQSTTATATTAVATNAGANAESVVTALSLFNGEITADAVTARASAGTGYSGAGGNANGSGVTNLKVGGQPVADGLSKIPLGDWGELTIGTQGIDRNSSARDGGLPRRRHRARRAPDRGPRRPAGVERDPDRVRRRGRPDGAGRDSDRDDAVHRDGAGDAGRPERRRRAAASAEGGRAAEVGAR